MHDYEVKHLEIVQSIVSRLATNSFLLKGWTITIAAALFALAAQDSNRIYSILAIFPAFAFWGLDAYYLRQERLFRKLYDDLRLKYSAGSAQPREAFSLSTKEYVSLVPSWRTTLWAPAVVGLHGVVVLSIIVVTLVLK